MFADRVIFVCIIIFTGVYVWGTTQIPTLQIGDPLGPKAFPYLLSIGLVIAAAMLLVDILRARKNGQVEEAKKKEPEDWRHLLVIAAVTIWTGLFYAMFEPLGYILSSAIFLIGLMVFFNRGKWIANILTAALFPVGSFYLFVHVLGVTLPSGILSF